jgi:hypothetical protein
MVDVYQDDVLIYSNIDCGSNTGAFSSGRAKFWVNTIGSGEGAQVDWYKVLDTTRSGSYSSKLVATGGAENGCLSDVFVVDINILYQIQNYYFVTAYVAGNAKLQIKFYSDAGGTSLISTSDIFDATAITSGWVDGTKTVGPGGDIAFPSTTLSIKIQQVWTGGSAEGTFFIDDISIPSSTSRVTGLKQFTTKKGRDYLLRATADGNLWSGPAVEIHSDWDALGDEVLKEGDFQTHVFWDTTGDFDDTGGNLAYTHTGGSGNATQIKGNFQRNLEANTEYELGYTVSGVTDTPACNLTTGIAAVLTALTMTNGAQTTRFTTNSNPQDFILDVPSSSGTDAFILDDITLKKAVAYPVDIEAFNERAVFTNGRNVPQIFTGLTVLDIPAAPVAGLVAETAGVITNGKHKCIATFINANGETVGSPESIEIDVVNNTIEGQVILTGIPIGPNEVTGRSIYMNEAGGSTFYKVTSGAGATIGDNHTTTYTINLADGTLNGYNVLPTTNTATTGSTSRDLGVDGIARPGALTSAGSGAGSGLLLDAAAVYSYKVTFHNVHGETIGGTASTNLTTVATWDQVDLTAIPTGPLGVISRSIYRTEGGGSDYKLLTVLSDNTTTTYTDNKADVNLGDSAPTSNTAATRSSDWLGTNQPKYCMVNDSQNLATLWLFGCPDNSRRIYNDPFGGEDFTEANAIQFDLGDTIVGAVQYGSRPIFFSKSEAWIIDNLSHLTSEWTYFPAPWRGGVAHDRLLIKVENDVYCMSDDGNIYSISTVQEYGDYKAASLSELFSFNRWIAQNVDLSYIEDFHVEYDPILRSVFWFVVRKGQTECDTAMVWSLDKQKWTIQDNRDYDSGFSASVSTLYDYGGGDFRIVTGDYSGRVWKLNEVSRNDNGNGYYAGFKFNKISYSASKYSEIENKHVDVNYIVQEVLGSHTLNVDIWVDGVASELNTQTVACDARYKTFDVGDHGRDFQYEIFNSNANEDFFLMALVSMIQYNGIAPV